MLDDFFSKLLVETIITCLKGKRTGPIDETIGERPKFLKS